MYTCLIRFHRTVPPIPPTFCRSGGDWFTWAGSVHAALALLFSTVWILRDSGRADSVPSSSLALGAGSSDPNQARNLYKNVTTERQTVPRTIHGFAEYSLRHGEDGERNRNPALFSPSTAHDGGRAATMEHWTDSQIVPRNFPTARPEGGANVARIPKAERDESCQGGVGGALGVVVVDKAVGVLQSEATDGDAGADSDVANGNAEDAGSQAKGERSMESVAPRDDAGLSEGEKNVGNEGIGPTNKKCTSSDEKVDAMDKFTPYREIDPDDEFLPAKRPVFLQGKPDDGDEDQRDERSGEISGEIDVPPAGGGAGEDEVWFSELRATVAPGDGSESKRYTTGNHNVALIVSGNVSPSRPPFPSRELTHRPLSASTDPGISLATSTSTLSVANHKIRRGLPCPVSSWRLQSPSTDAGLARAGSQASGGRADPGAARGSITDGGSDAGIAGASGRAGSPAAIRLQSPATATTAIPGRAPPSSGLSDVGFGVSVVASSPASIERLPAPSNAAHAHSIERGKRYNGREMPVLASGTGRSRRRVRSAWSDPASSAPGRHDYHGVPETVPEIIPETVPGTGVPANLQISYDDRNDQRAHLQRHSQGSTSWHGVTEVAEVVEGGVVLHVAGRRRWWGSLEKWALPAVVVALWTRQVRLPLRRMTYCMYAVSSCRFFVRKMRARTYHTGRSKRCRAGG